MSFNETQRDDCNPKMKATASGDVGNCRWFTGSSVIERASSRRPTFNGVKAALYTTAYRSTGLNSAKHAGFHGSSKGLSGNRLQGHRKLPSTAYYSKQVEAALFRQYTNHNKQINSARARWLSWLPSQNPGTSMGGTSIEPRTEVRRYTQSNSSGKPSTTQAKVSWTIIEDIHSPT